MNLFNLFKPKKKHFRQVVNPITYHIRPFRVGTAGDIYLHFVDYDISKSLHELTRQYIRQEGLLDKDLLVSNLYQQGNAVGFSLGSYKAGVCSYAGSDGNTIDLCINELSQLFGGIPLNLYLKYK